ncbi:MAG TPA: ATP-binding protein [Parasegetibacter sp.]
MIKSLLIPVIFLFLALPVSADNFSSLFWPDTVPPEKGSSAYIKWLERLNNAKDSAYKAENEKILEVVQVKYELQKKENTIIQQHLELARKDFLTYMSLIAALAVLLTTILLIQSHRIKVRKKWNEMLKAEKQRAFDAIKEAEEKERMRIASDLHDNLGAYAASMASNLDAIELKLSDIKQSNAFRELRNYSLSIISELNDTIWVIKKEALPLSAIGDRIKMFIQKLAPSYPYVHMEVDESIDNDHELSAAQAFHLYRIVQEALNNALKHSRGTRITVKIISYASWLINITDNGSGFEINPISGNGLFNMKFRAEECGWKLEIERGEKKGTIVSISPANTLHNHN